MSHLVVFSQQESLEIWSCFLGSGAMLLAIGRSMEERSTVGEIKLAQMTMPQASWHWMPLHVYDSNDPFVDEYCNYAGLAASFIRLKHMDTDETKIGAYFFWQVNGWQSVYRHTRFTLMHPGLDCSLHWNDLAVLMKDLTWNEPDWIWLDSKIFWPSWWSRFSSGKRVMFQQLVAKCWPGTCGIISCDIVWYSVINCSETTVSGANPLNLFSNLTWLCSCHGCNHSKISSINGLAEFRCVIEQGNEPP